MFYEDLEKTVKNNQGLVGIVVKRAIEMFPRAYNNNDDLKQSAFLALIKCHKCYDKTRGFKFSTYAYNSMWREVLKQINNSSIIRQSEYNIKKKRFKVPYTTPINEETLQKKYENENENLEDLELEFQEIINFLKNDESISKRNFDMFILRFRNGEKLKDIAIKNNISKERVRQCIEKILLKIRNYYDIK